MNIQLKRVYEKPGADDGIRILVERLWPRGLSMEKVKADIWLKDAAPSSELRKWFSHDPSKWEEFKRQYYLELDKNPEVIKPILELIDEGNITFLFATRDVKSSSALALKKYILNRVPER